MQSQITFHLEKLETGIQRIVETPVISPLRSATTEILMLAAGNITAHSISNYFAHIVLFEHNFNRKNFIDFSIKEPSYFMLTDRKKNTCNLFFRPKGKYKKIISPGPNQIMLITFRSDWLIYKCRRLKEVQPFSAMFISPQKEVLNLPSVGIAESLFKSLQKMDTALSNINLLNNDGYHFVNGCINTYYNKLKGRSKTSEIHHRLATEISLFIHKYYTSEQVDNTSNLTERFMVSERNLARLAHIAFGMPLREQVIKLRMGYAKHLLTTTSNHIKDIALLCGYKDPHYFSKAFKKYYGLSPKLLLQQTFHN